MEITVEVVVPTRSQFCRPSNGGEHDEDANPAQHPARNAHRLAIGYSECAALEIHSHVTSAPPFPAGVPSSLRWPACNLASEARRQTRTADTEPRGIFVVA